MQKILYCLFFLVCIIILGCSAKDTTPQAANPMGLSGKRIPEAETAYARARILWNKDDECADPEEALALLDKAIALEPTYADAYTRRGLAKSALRDWEGAFNDLSIAIRSIPSAENYAFRGLISILGGNYLGARKDLERSLSITSRQHRAWLYRGILNRLEGSNQQACDDYTKACDYGDCKSIYSAREAGQCPR